MESVPRRRFARRRVARIPRVPRFPRIATYADTITQRSGRRLRADPSTHISGIVHSCPHLGYLNYICNAYRGTVGTEYVGADPAHTRHPRMLARVSPTYGRLLIGVRTRERSHIHTFMRDMQTRVCAQQRQQHAYVRKLVTTTLRLVIALHTSAAVSVPFLPDINHGMQQ